MALVRCPECSREGVSDRALACPSCGFPVGTQTLAAQGGEVFAPDGDPQNLTSDPEPAPDDPQPVAKSINRLGLVLDCRGYIRRYLNPPDGGRTSLGMVKIMSYYDLRAWVDYAMARNQLGAERPFMLKVKDVLTAPEHLARPILPVLLTDRWEQAA